MKNLYVWYERFMDRHFISPDAAKAKTNWMKRHYIRLQYRTWELESSIQSLQFGWTRFADAYRAANDAEVCHDAVLWNAWKDIGQGVKTLMSLAAGCSDDARLDKLFAPLLDCDEVCEEGRLFIKQSGRSCGRVSLALQNPAFNQGRHFNVTGDAEMTEFNVPTFVTEQLWDDICAIPERLKHAMDSESRLRDMLLAGQKVIAEKDIYKTYRFMLEMPIGEKSMYEAKAFCQPNDAGKPVLILMRTSEEERGRKIGCGTLQAASSH